jgi:acetyl-CoA carboxylase biotin carboxyl carrier protein
MGHVVVSPVRGNVWKVNVALGDAVAVGEEVVTVESMKMEIPAEAEEAGTVTAILCAEGDSIEEDQPLVDLG